MQQIQQIEKELGLSLSEVKSFEELKSIWASRSFLLNSQNEVIGLHLYDCGVSNLQFLKPIKKLQYLIVENNTISSLNDLADKIELKHLNLSGNSISSLHDLANKTELEELDLSQNNITSLQDLRSLSKMRSLDLRFNQIEKIAPLTNLVRLKNLDLRGNMISDISPLLDHVRRGMDVTFEGYVYNSINIMSNNIDPALLSIFKKGNEAIVRYFERINEEGFDFIYEAKVTLVGEGGAGKTSLATRLIDEDAALPIYDSRTRGIKIYDWEFKSENNKKFIAHLWDFGGQDVYFPVHRFFITENALFLLLGSSRQAHHNFDYWIPTIFQFSGQSPIIIAKTCFDDNVEEWKDISKYLVNTDYNIIKTQRLPYYKLNLPNSNEGLRDIKSVIIDQIENLKHFGKKVPKSWVLIRDKISIKSKSLPCISFEDFAEICHSNNEGSNYGLIDIEDIADFFHSLGIILWYKNVSELRSWVILQPSWAMNAVYKIIDDKGIQKNLGSIILEDFNRIWNDTAYLHRHFILKKMLEVFKIAFPRKNKPSDYIMPAWLESMPSEELWQSTQGLLTIEYHFDFMPKGLINQVSAELSRLIINEKSIWNNGVIFQDDERISQCQLVESFHQKKVFLKAKGKEARALIKIVMNSINNILDEYRGVKPIIMVPCSCSICKKSEVPVLFSYDKLLEWLMKKSTIRCNESDEDILINDLLFYAGLSEIRQEEGFSKHENTRLKTFISYSKFDGEECNKRDGINYLELFKESLAPLTKHIGLMETWDDTNLIPGENWDIRIKNELKTADVIFLLVSSSFLNTNYIINTELKIAFQRENQGECLVIPIIIKECGWQDIEWISKNNVLPRKGNTIASQSASSINSSKAWNDVYIEVKKAIEYFKSRR